MGRFISELTAHEFSNWFRALVALKSFTQQLFLKGLQWQQRNVAMYIYSCIEMDKSGRLQFGYHWALGLGNTTFNWYQNYKMISVTITQYLHEFEQRFFLYFLNKRHNINEDITTYRNIPLLFLCALPLLIIHLSLILAWQARVLNISTGWAVIDLDEMLEKNKYARCVALCEANGGHKA